MYIPRVKRAIRIPSVLTSLRLLPIGKKLGLIVVLFVLIVGCLLVLANVQMEILSGVRAYVGGEGLWSKGEKDAVHHLARYAETRDERDYRRYLDAIAVRGAALHGEIRSGRGSPEQGGALLEQIGVLDQRLTPLEDAFSRTLSK